MTGCRGRLLPCADPVYLENSGTSMRLLTAVASLGQGKYTLTGTERMAQRPIGDLLDALGQLGISARSINGKRLPAPGNHRRPGCRRPGFHPLRGEQPVPLGPASHGPVHPKGAGYPGC